MRFYFSMLHSGYLRGYGGAIRLLAERGHTIHLAFGNLETDQGDRRLAEELAAACPSVTYGRAPRRSPRDAWRALAWLVRASTDLTRYMDPRYAGATALRERAVRDVTAQLRRAQGVGPLAGSICPRFLRFLSAERHPRRRRWATAALGAVERAIPTSRAVDRALARFRPDAVLVVPLVEFGSTQVEFLKSARRLGIRTGVCVSSWDNLTNKGLIRVVPDRVFVWNEVQRREAMELHGVPAEAVVLTGAQRFDEWFERRPTLSAPDFARKVGLDPDEPYLLYLCSASFIAPDEATFVLRWASRIREHGDSRLARVGLLVRPHPRSAAQWRRIDLSHLGNASVWPPEGAQPDAGEAREDYFHSLAWCAAVVGINTSALIEGAILGKRAYSVRVAEFRGGQDETLHWQYLLHEKGGFLHVAGSLEDHVEQLAQLLAAHEEASEQPRRFVASFVRPHGLDRPATPILADALEELAALAPPKPAPAPLWAWPLRLALGLLGVGTGLLVAATWLIRQAAAGRSSEERAAEPRLVQSRP